MAKRRPSGDGMVRKRDDGRWEGRIVIGHKENGEPLFRHVYAKTQKALLDKLHQNIENYRDVELTEDSRMTLGEWLDRWLTEYKAGTVRPGTLESYRRYIDLYIKPQLGGKQVSLVSQQDIQRMYRRLKTDGRIREHPELDHHLSDAMIRHIHSMLHAAMKDAVQAHVIPKNPTEGTTTPKPNYKPKRILTRAELEKLLSGDYGFLLASPQPLCREFYFECVSNLLRPRVVVDYEREPWVQKEGTVRITFDRDVRAAVGGWDLFDQHLPTLPVLDPGTLVLEVKFTEFLPEVLRQLLPPKAQEWTAVSKYVLCADKTAYRHGFSGWND